MNYGIICDAALPICILYRKQSHSSDGHEWLCRQQHLADPEGVSGGEGRPPGFRQKIEGGSTPPPLKTQN